MNEAKGLVESQNIKNGEGQKSNKIGKGMPHKKDN